MDEFPDDYVVYHQRGMRGYAEERYFEALRDGMRGGDPAVDVVDVDGEKCVVNCQMVDLMHLSTKEGRERCGRFIAFIEKEDKKYEWDK